MSVANVTNDWARGRTSSAVYGKRSNVKEGFISCSFQGEGRREQRSEGWSMHPGSVSDLRNATPPRTEEAGRQILSTGPNRLRQWIGWKSRYFGYDAHRQLQVAARDAERWE